MFQGIKKNKLGISTIVTYILLIGIAIVLGGTIYTWMKSFVPKESLDCPEGTTLSITDYIYNCSNISIINITFKNTGRFDVAGYYIHASNVSGYKMATIDLSKNFAIRGNGDLNYSGAIVINKTVDNLNPLLPTQETWHIFNNLNSIGRIYLIEIAPVRWQKEDNKLRFIGCGDDSKSQETISCQ